MDDGDVPQDGDEDGVLRAVVDKSALVAHLVARAREKRDAQQQ